MFVTENSLENLEKAAKTLSIHFGTKASLFKTNAAQGFDERFILEQNFPSWFTEKEISVAHKKIYHIFRHYLK